MERWKLGTIAHSGVKTKITYGGIGNDTPAHKPMGDLPNLGEWVRLEVDPAVVGLKTGSVLNGMAFAQFGGKAYWGYGWHRNDSRCCNEEYPR